jgi:hypothetical protein
MRLEHAHVWTNQKLLDVVGQYAAYISLQSLQGYTSYVTHTSPEIGMVVTE